MAGHPTYLPPHLLRALLLTAAFLLGAPLTACMPSLQAVGSDDTATGDPGHVDAIEGVSLHAFGDSWDLEPRGLPRRVTPIEIVIVNESRRDLQVRADDFRLVDGRGRALTRLSPFQVTHDLADAHPAGGRSPLPALPMASGQGFSLLPAGALEDALALLPGSAVSSASGSAADVARGATGRTYLSGARDVVYDPASRPRGRTVRTDAHRPQPQPGAQGGTWTGPWWHGHTAYTQPAYRSSGALPGQGSSGYGHPGYGSTGYATSGYGHPGYWHHGHAARPGTTTSWHVGFYASPVVWGAPLPWGGYVVGHPGYGWHGWRTHGHHGWHGSAGYGHGWHGQRWHGHGWHGSRGYSPWHHGGYGYGWHRSWWRTWYGPTYYGPYGPAWHAHGLWGEGWKDAPPPPMMEAPAEGSADFAQMRISQVSLRDTSLAPGEATGGFLFFERVPRGQEVLLEWTPRSWRAREGLRPVTVRMVAR